MQARGLGEDAALDIATLAHEFLGGVAVVAVNNILCDNRAFVQVLGHIMRGGADQLDAPLKGALIGIGPHEGRQETVVDVDDALRIGPHNKRFQNLHVTRQDEEIDRLANQIEHAALVLLALLFADRQMVLGDSIHLRQGLQVGMIAQDKHQVHRQFAAFPAPQQIGQAVVQL